MCAGCDDFFVPSAMKEVVNYMKVNSDVSACAGQTIGFGVQDGNYHFFLKHSLEYLTRSANRQSDEIMSRVYSCLSPPSGVFYSIMRRSVYVELLRTKYAKFPIQYGALFERIIPLLFSILGKFAVIPVFFSARSQVSQPESADKKKMHISKLLTLWPSDVRDEYEIMIGSVAEVLSRKTDEHSNVCLSIVDNAMRVQLPQQYSWSRSYVTPSREHEELADSIDRQLLGEERLHVRRRDIFGMPFPEAEKLFPVFSAIEELDAIKNCVGEAPVELLSTNNWVKTFSTL